MQCMSAEWHDVERRYTGGRLRDVVRQVGLQRGQLRDHLCRGDGEWVRRLQHTHVSARHFVRDHDVRLKVLLQRDDRDDLQVHLQRDRHGLLQGL